MMLDGYENMVVPMFKNAIFPALSLGPLHLPSTVIEAHYA